MYNPLSLLSTARLPIERIVWVPDRSVMRKQIVWVSEQAFRYMPDEKSHRSTHLIKLAQSIVGSRQTSLVLTDKMSPRSVIIYDGSRRILAFDPHEYSSTAGRTDAP
jgi:hypothetical protein